MGVGCPRLFVAYGFCLLKKGRKGERSMSVGGSETFSKEICSEAFYKRPKEVSNSGELRVHL